VDGGRGPMWMSLGRAHCFDAQKRRDSEAQEELTFVDVGGVGLLARLGALLLVTRGSGLLAGLLLLGGGLGSGSLGGGLLLSGGFGRHFESLGLVGDEGWLMKLSEMGVGVDAGRGGGVDR
jgi:hypothetical protein